MATPDTVRDDRDAESRVICLRLPSRPEDLVPAGASRQWLVVEAPTHCYVPKVLDRQGLAGYEPEAVACFLAVTAVARPGAVWDVGANAGVYGLLARALSQRAVLGSNPPLTSPIWRRASQWRMGCRIPSGASRSAPSRGPPRCTCRMSPTAPTRLLPASDHRRKPPPPAVAVSMVPYLRRAAVPGSEYDPRRSHLPQPHVALRSGAPGSAVLESCGSLAQAADLLRAGAASARYEPRRRRDAEKAPREFATSRSRLSRLEASVTAGAEYMAAKLVRYPFAGPARDCPGPTDCGTSSRGLGAIKINSESHHRADETNRYTSVHLGGSSLHTLR